MRALIITLIIWSCSFQTSVYAQPYDSIRQLIKTTDSDTLRVTLLNELSKEIAFQNKDSSKLLAEQALVLSEQLRFPKGIASSHYNIAFSWHINGSYDSAIFHYERASEYSSEIEDIKALARIENNLGAIYATKGDYTRALFYFQSSLEKKIKLNATNEFGNAYNNIGIISQEQKDYEGSIRYFEKSIYYQDSINNDAGVARSLGNIALSYTKLQKYQEAVDAYKEAYIIVLEQKIPIQNMYNANGLAETYLLMDEIDSAFKYGTEAYAQSIQENDPVITSSSLNALGVVNRKKGNWALAENQLQRAYSVAVENELLPYQKNASLELYRFYKTIGNYKKSLQYLELNKSVNDSLFNESLTEQLTAMSLNFAFQQEKDSINFAFEKERLDLNADIRRKTLTQNLTVVGLVIAIIFIFIVYRFYRLKTKSNQQLSEKNEIISTSLKEKDALIKEIHHRVKNNLQIVSSLLNIQSKFVEDREAQKAIQDMQNRVISMSLVHQNLYESQSVTHVFTDEYLDNLVKSVNKTFNNLDDPISFETAIERVKVSSNQAVKLGLAVNEILTNAFKHAFPSSFKGEPQISVQVKGGAEKVKLEVSDNGVGFSKSKAEDSYGFRLIRSLTKSMNGTLEVSEEERTCITLEVPTEHEL